MIQSADEIRFRRSAVPLTFCPRWQLAEGTPQGGTPSSAFLRDLRRIDRDLELYWHPRLSRWLLYRVVRRGGCPSEDQLMLEFDVVGPRGEYREPGAWLLDLLRSADKYRGGSISPGKANELYRRRLKEHLDESNKREKAVVDGIVDNTVTETVKYAFGRHSVHVNRT